MPVFTPARRSRMPMRPSWVGRVPARRAFEHGLHFFVSHYKRADGFYRTKVAPDGTPLDDHIELYDQAFAPARLCGSAYASR